MGAGPTLRDLATGAVAGFEVEVGELSADVGAASFLDDVSSFFFPKPQKRRLPVLGSVSDECKVLSIFEVV